MKVPDFIESKINRLPVGYVFTYEDFNLQVDKVDALTKALSRLVQEEKIRKLSPGRFYKPRRTDFGELKPEVYQVVKDLLEQNGKILGYLTGYSAYNQLGLTSQVSSIIQIGTNEPKKSITRGVYKIRFIKQPNKITKGNIAFLRILDAIRNIKEIPGTTVQDSCNTLIALIKKIDKEKREDLVRLAKKYNPAGRALSGAIFDLCFGCELAEPLLKSLNPSSEYEFDIPDSILPNKLKWNIR